MGTKHLHTLRKFVIKVLSQTASSSACERNWSTFALIHTKQRNHLAYHRLQQLVFYYYNMKLKLHDMETENDRAVEKDYFDLLDISARWVKKIINYSNGLGIFTCMMKLVILIHELLLMLENLKFIVKVLTKILRIHFKGHWIPTKRLTPQVSAKVVDLELLILLLLIMMVQEVKLIMEVMT